MPQSSVLCEILWLRFIVVSFSACFSFRWHKDVKKRPEAGKVVEYMKSKKAGICSVD
jgi:hypothetical protein